MAYVIAGLALSCLLCFIVCEAQDIINVSPSCSSALGSGNDSCLDIDMALREIRSGSTLLLEPGTHIIEETHHGELYNLSNITVTGCGVHLTTITCTESNGLAFISTRTLIFANFTITNCGITGENLNSSLTLLKERVDLWFVVPLTARIALFVGDCEDVSMQDVLITETRGIGLLGINIIGNSVLTRINFTRNIRPQCTAVNPVLPEVINKIIADRVGGGAYFLYSDYHNTSRVTDAVTLNVTQSYFAFNADCTPAATVSLNYPYFVLVGGQQRHRYRVGAGGGLSVVMTNSFYHTEVSITNTTFYKNDALYGGGAYVAMFAGHQYAIRVSFIECNFSENGLASRRSNYGSEYFYEPYCNGGGGLAIFTDLLKPEHFSTSVPTSDFDATVTLARTNFAGNMAEFEGGGLMAHSLGTTPRSSYNYNNLDYYTVKWILFDIQFLENSAQYSSAVSLAQMNNFGFSTSVLSIFTDVNVNRNHYDNSLNGDKINGDENSCAMHFKRILVSFQGSSTISDNDGSGMIVESSVLTIISQLTLSRNRAHRGGAIHYKGRYPILILYANSTLRFIENTALIEGGAIYREPLTVPNNILKALNFSDCIFITLGLSTFSRNFGIFDSGITVEFQGNSAPHGSTVFGSSLRSCPWALDIVEQASSNQPFYEILERDFNSTFIFDGDDTVSNRFSSLPAYIEVSIDDQALFLGRVIYIDVNVFDEYGNYISVVVTSSVLNVGESSLQSFLGDSGFWYTGMEKAPFYVKGPQHGVFNVSIFTEINAITTTVAINISSCPIGFPNQDNQCRCSDLFRNLTMIVCQEQSGSFTKSYDENWIGVYDDIVNATTEDIVIASCLLNYCNQLLTISPPQFDEQCSFNRSGVLCGKCSEGYSHVLGTNECLVCSNYSLLLLPLFAVLGILYFSAIALLKFTVDKGLSNSVILLINLISLYDYRSQTNIVSYSHLPLRLMNLQIGVGICFYDGMTALTRSLFQYLFPAYLFVLMGVFILLCRRFTFLSVRFSPAKSFMTLGIICYLNILIVCLEMLIPIPVVTITGKRIWKWYLDPNQKYFGGWQHFFQGILSVLLMISYIIPVPFLLLFPSLTYRLAGKYSPYLDALWAAYKPKLRFWLGIRLILIVTVYIFTRVPGEYGFIASGITLVIFSHIQTRVQPLKDKQANIMDLFFIIIVVIWYSGIAGVRGINRDNITLTFVIFSLFTHIINLFLYSGIAAVGILHLHQQFPSLFPKCKNKLCSIYKPRRKQKKLDTVLYSSGVVAIPQEEDGGTSYIRQSSLEQPPPLAPPPQYRDSIFLDEDSS